MIYPSKEFEKYKYRLLKHCYNIMDWVKKRNNSVEGCEKFYLDIEDRILEFCLNPPNGICDARLNREFIIYPESDSKRLDIPEKSVIDLSKEFGRFGLFNLWIRAICPKCNEVCAETDDAKVFVESLKDSICCGSDYTATEIPVKYITRFYAIHLPTLEEFGKMKTDGLIALVKRFFRSMPNPNNS